MGSWETALLGLRISQNYSGFQNGSEQYGTSGFAEWKSSDPLPTLRHELELVSEAFSKLVNIEQLGLTGGEYCLDTLEHGGMASNASQSKRALE